MEISDYAADCMAYVVRTEEMVGAIQAAGLECACVLAHPAAAQFVLEETNQDIQEIWGVPVALTADVVDRGETIAMTPEAWENYLDGEPVAVVQWEPGE